MRTRHPYIHQTMILMRRKGDMEEFEKLEMPVNSYLGFDEVKTVKERLCKLSHLRKRLPPDPE